MKSCDMFRVQQLELDPDPSLDPLSKSSGGAVYITPIFPTLCPIRMVHAPTSPVTRAACVCPVVMSWLPWVEGYGNCCNPRFCFPLAQSLSRSFRFPASAFLLVSSVWSVKTCVCSWVVFHGELWSRSGPDSFLWGSSLHHAAVQKQGWWTDALGLSTFSLQSLYSSRTIPFC